MPRERGREGVAPALKGGGGLERTGVRGTEEENEEDVSRRKSVNQVRETGPTARCVRQMPKDATQPSASDHCAHRGTKLSSKKTIYSTEFSI